MEQKKKILVLINPISGTNNKAYLPEIVNEKLNHEIFDIEIRFTQRANHAYALSREASDKGYFGVVAIGGDGTVNEAASALCHTQTALGIIPNGSGNGLARHLNIPINITKALEIINEGTGWATLPLAPCA